MTATQPKEELEDEDDESNGFFDSITNSTVVKEERARGNRGRGNHRGGYDNNRGGYRGDAYRGGFDRSRGTHEGQRGGYDRKRGDFHG